MSVRRQLPKTKLLESDRLRKNKISPVWTKCFISFAVAFIFYFATPQAQASLLLSRDLLTEPFFVQPFAGLQVVEESGGISKTDAFFSDLPDNSIDDFRVANLLGNFQAFDPSSAPITFSLFGVEVTDNGSTFNPAFGSFDFAGHPSETFTDSVDADTATYFSTDATFAFAFKSTPALKYSYRLLTDLPVGSSIVYDDVETAFVPEPATIALFGFGLLGLPRLRKEGVFHCRRTIA